MPLHVLLSLYVHFYNNVRLPPKPKVCFCIAGLLNRVIREWVSFCMEIRNGENEWTLLILKSMLPLLRLSLRKPIKNVFAYKQKGSKLLVFFSFFFSLCSLKFRMISIRTSIWLLIFTLTLETHSTSPERSSLSMMYLELYYNHL